MFGKPLGIRTIKAGMFKFGCGEEGEGCSIEEGCGG